MLCIGNQPETDSFPAPEYGLWPKLLIENWQNICLPAPQQSQFLAPPVSRLANEVRPHIVIYITREGRVIGGGRRKAGRQAGRSGHKICKCIIWYIRSIGERAINNPPAFVQSDYRVLLTIDIHIRFTLRAIEWTSRANPDRIAGDRRIRQISNIDTYAGGIHNLKLASPLWLIVSINCAFWKFIISGEMTGQCADENIIVLFLRLYIHKLRKVGQWQDNWDSCLVRMNEILSQFQSFGEFRFRPYQRGEGPSFFPDTAENSLIAPPLSVR